MSTVGVRRLKRKLRKIQELLGWAYPQEGGMWSSVFHRKLKDTDATYRVHIMVHRKRNT